ncbi:hypothetical protein Y1Q_0021695 [Alligator mississippiensis]|uniref:ribonuclease H n=1 Tax=Alligator mississippiensis TaxID=8496 RepID=A0A151PAZ2_ALLMI|nr:hypothetical protein Y1Q_0021695 [Alligator mississippiensis]
MKTTKAIMVQGLNATATTARVKFSVTGYCKPLEAVLGGINILEIPGIKALQLKEQILQALPLSITGPDRHQPTLCNTSTWRYKPIPTKDPLKGALINLLQCLEQQGCIKPITASTRLLPGWGIAKPGKPNEVRLVVDYHEANKRCQPLMQPSPSMRPQCLYEMAQFQKDAWVGTTLDLKDMFLSIPINDVEGVRNMCVNGTMYKWTVCPQGYRNALALATGAMNDTLKEFRTSYILPGQDELKFWSYIDDLAIMGRTQQAVAKVTNNLVTHLSNKGWTVSLKKSKLQPTADITFLGTKFVNKTRFGVTHKSPDTGPLERQLPTDKKRLQQLLGYLNWYRHHITPTHLLVLAKLQRQIRKKSQRFTPWTERDGRDLYKLLTAIRTMPLHAFDLADPMTVTLGYTASHVWATAHNSRGELTYTSHQTLQAAQHRYGAVGKTLMAGQLIELLSHGHGTLWASGATLLPLLNARKPDPQFQREPSTWNTLVLNHHYHWHCWKCEDLPPSPDTTEAASPVLYGTTAPAWMASDSTTRGDGGYGFYCKPCHDMKLYLGYSSAQKNELLGFKEVIQHCLQHHDGTLPTTVIAIDSQYIYKIITGTGAPMENPDIWRDIYDMLPTFTVLPLTKHTKSHRPETDPVHEVIDKLLEDPLRTDIVLAVEQVKQKDKVDPFLAWLHDH